MAHSLGSVLAYDILCNQPHLFASLKPSDAEQADSAGGPTSASGEARNASLDLQPFSSHDLDPSLPRQVRLSMKWTGALLSSSTVVVCQHLPFPHVTRTRDCNSTCWQEEGALGSGAQASTPSGTTPTKAITSDLIDLTGLTSTPQPSAAGIDAQVCQVPVHPQSRQNQAEGLTSWYWVLVQVQRLQEENTRLRLELTALRQASSRGASTSKATGAQDAMAEAGGQLAPPVRIKPLAFAVDRLFLAGSASPHATHFSALPVHLHAPSHASCSITWQSSRGGHHRLTAGHLPGAAQCQPGQGQGPGYPAGSAAYAGLRAHRWRWPAGRQSHVQRLPPLRPCRLQARARQRAAPVHARLCRNSYFLAPMETALYDAAPVLGMP